MGVIGAMLKAGYKEIAKSATRKKRGILKKASGQPVKPQPAQKSTTKRKKRIPASSTTRRK